MKHNNSHRANGAADSRAVDHHAADSLGAAGHAAALDRPGRGTGQAGGTAAYRQRHTRTHGLQADLRETLATIQRKLDDGPAPNQCFSDLVDGERELGAALFHARKVEAVLDSLAAGQLGHAHEVTTEAPDAPNALDRMIELERAAMELTPEERIGELHQLDCGVIQTSPPDEEGRSGYVVSSIEITERGLAAALAEHQLIRELREAEVDRDEGVPNPWANPVASGAQRPEAGDGEEVYREG